MDAFITIDFHNLEKKILTHNLHSHFVDEISARKSFVEIPAHKSLVEEFENFLLKYWDINFKKQV